MEKRKRELSSSSDDESTAKRKMTEILAKRTRDWQLNHLQDVGWAIVAGRDAIKKEFLFKNFNEAIGFMTRVALFVEKIDHHPDWSNVNNKVEVTLTIPSRDVSGRSVLDVRMADFMEEVAASFKKIQIIMKTMCGREFTLEVHPSATIGSVKTRVKDHSGMPEDQLRFIFAGMQLMDDRTLSEYNIQNESTIHVIYRLCGC